MENEGKNILRTILNRLKEVENISNDKDLAAPLMVSSNTIESWKYRESVPWEKLFTYSRKHKISLEWLVNGRGPQRSENLIAEEGAIYHVETDQDAVYDIAAQLHAALQGREIPADKFSQAVKLLHREFIDSCNYPRRDKINELIKLL